MMITCHYFYLSKGRPTEDVSELQIKAYGAVDARGYIPGAEALEENGDNNTGENEDADSSAGGSDGSWVDVSDEDDDGDGWINVSQDDSDAQDDAEDSPEGENEEGDEDGWESVDGEDAEGGGDMISIELDKSVSNQSLLNQ